MKIEAQVSLNSCSVILWSFAVFHAAVRAQGECAWVERRTLAATEDEPGALWPSEEVGGLINAERRDDRNGASTSAALGGYHALARIPGAAYMDKATFKVDVLVLKCLQFARSQPGVGRRRPKATVRFGEYAEQLRGLVRTRDAIALTTYRPAEPSQLSSAVPNWGPGETIHFGHKTMRVVAVRDDDADQPPALVVEDVT